MAQRKKAATTRRGSPEAIAKRRSARRLHALLATAGSPTLFHGQTTKRRERLLAELDKGTAAPRTMKPIQILVAVNDLLSLGVARGEIRAVVHGRARPKISADMLVSMVREIHAAFALRPESYGFIGVPYDVLVDARVVDAGAPRRGRPPARRGKR